MRNISSASVEANLLNNFRAASNELLHPLLLACGTRQTKLVQIALQGIQRLVQYRILEAVCLPGIFKFNMSFSRLQM